MKLNGIDEDNLLDLYAENFVINGDTLRDLVDNVIGTYKYDEDGGVKAGIEDFIYLAFNNDMYKCREGVGSFDEYVTRVRFSYGKEAFMEYLRDVWEHAYCYW